MRLEIIIVDNESQPDRDVQRCVFAFVFAFVVVFVLWLACARASPHASLPSHVWGLLRTKEQDLWGRKLAPELKELHKDLKMGSCFLVVENLG